MLISARIQGFQSDRVGFFPAIVGALTWHDGEQGPNPGIAAVPIQEQEPENRVRRDGILLHCAPLPRPSPAWLGEAAERRADAEAACPAIDGKRPPRDIERQQPEPVKCVCLNFLSVGTINHWHGSSCWPAASCRWRRC